MLKEVASKMDQLGCPGLYDACSLLRNSALADLVYSFCLEDGGSDFAGLKWLMEHPDREKIHEMARGSDMDALRRELNDGKGSSQDEVSGV